MIDLVGNPDCWFPCANYRFMFTALAFIPKKIFPEWQSKSFPWSCLWKVYRDTTENIRVTVIPFYMGFRVSYKLFPIVSPICNKGDLRLILVSSTSFMFRPDMTEKLLTGMLSLNTNKRLS